MWDERAEHEIDAAIDRVARELTEGASDANIKARVLARVEAAASPEKTRYFGWTAPVVVAVLLLLAFAVWRRADIAPAPTVTTPPQQTARATSEPNADHGAVNPPTPEESARTPRTSRTPRTPRTLRPPSVVATLAPPPLTVDPLGVEPMEAMRSIQLSEMTVPAIDIPPLPSDK
jgi:hypothetical protein